MAGTVDTKFVKYEVKDRIAYITLNRPEAMNALSQGLLADLNTAFREAGRDDDVLVVILSGEGGRAFSAGMDLKEFSARQAEQAAAGQPPAAIGAAEGAEHQRLHLGRPVPQAGDRRDRRLVPGRRVRAGHPERHQGGQPQVGLRAARSQAERPGRPGLTQLPRMIPLAEALRIALTGPRSVPSGRCRSA